MIRDIRAPGILTLNHALRIESLKDAHVSSLAMAFWQRTIELIERDGF